MAPRNTKTKNVPDPSLNDSQREAVLLTECPLLVIAGPGSGKTKTLVERILYLMAVKEVPAERILVATFTEKAAKELVTRVSNRAMELDLPVNLSDMYIGTLHSIFLRILEENRKHTRFQRNYRVFDGFEQQYFVYRNLAAFREVEGFDLLVEEKSAWTGAQNICGMVNKTAEESLDLDELEAAKDLSVAALGRVAKRYRALLIEENALDFSVIQTEMLHLIQSHPEILAGLQERIQYVMVDEYQDTNTVQELILMKLAAAGNRICVVGDDDQGLYRFRGATIRNILEFEKNFPDGACRRIELSVNYRSPPGIIDFCRDWMDSIPGGWEGDAGETYRFPKELTPRPGGFPKMPAVVKASAEGSPEAWHGEVLDFITTLRKKGVLRDYNQIAFLFRSVKGERAVGLARYLETHGINVFSPRSDLFFQREEIRLMIGAFVFLFPNLIDGWLKWNEKAELGIWDYYGECMRLFADAIRADKETHEPMRQWCAARAKSHAALSKNTDYGFSSLFYELLQFPMFSRHMDADLSAGVTDLRPIYNLALFSQLLTQFEFLHNVTVLTVERLRADLQGLFNRYLRFLHDGGIAEYEGFDQYAPSGCVSFMTIHQAKGLEFPVVFVDSLNLVPRKDYEELDAVLQAGYYRKKPFEPLDRIKFFDFWRLYYTAFSRAKNLLVLTGEEKEGHGALPSKYFKPVYDPLPSWRDRGLKISGIELDPVNPVLLKHEYSFTSHIMLYENCPAQYKFFKELEFSPVRTNAALFGTLVHETIEDVHRTVLEGKQDQVTDDRIDEWFDRNYRSLSRSTHTYLAPGAIKVAKRQVLSYVERSRGNWEILREAEVMVSLLQRDYILRGKIDLIRGEGDKVEILDFKTEKKPEVNTPKGREKLERYRRQLDVYAHIVEGKHGHSVSRMHLYFTGADGESPYVTYEYEKNNVATTIGKIEGVVRRIEDKDYRMGVGQKTDQLCGNCDMRHYCGSN